MQLPPPLRITKVAIITVPTLFDILSIKGVTFSFKVYCKVLEPYIAAEVVYASWELWVLKASTYLLHCFRIYNTITEESKSPCSTQKGSCGQQLTASDKLVFCVNETSLQWVCHPKPHHCKTQVEQNK